MLPPTSLPRSTLTAGDLCSPAPAQAQWIVSPSCGGYLQQQDPQADRDGFEGCGGHKSLASPVSWQQGVPCMPTPAWDLGQLPT